MTRIRFIQSSALILALGIAFLLDAGRDARANSGRDNPIKIQRRTVDNRIDFYVSNTDVVSYWAELSFARLVNMNADVKLPHGFVVEPGTRDRKVLSLRPADPRKGRYYTLNLAVRPGNRDPATVRHDNSSIYLLPFAHGTKHKVSQGYNGRTSHRGSLNYSLDFAMPIGTPIFAARGGLVIDVKSDSRIGGPGPRYANHSNYIRVYHEDGTIADYAHLKYGGVAVRKGDQVEAGQLIGYSGNTGQSDGPHLHFHVLGRSYNGRRRTIPTLFTDHENRNVRIEPGWYYARHPGKPEFPVVLGSKLRDETYRDYRKAIPAGRGVKVRFDRVDDTSLVFIRNSESKPQEVTLSFRKRNLTSSRPTPYTRIVPARSEVYALLLRPVRAARSYELRYSVRYRRALPRALRRPPATSRPGTVPGGG